jgi:hypothetical protein
VCSIGVNSIANAELEQLKRSNDHKIIENRLKHLAANSQLGQPGFLDLPNHHMTGMPAALKAMRRIHIGRHRVFYTGQYSQCSFTVFYIKSFKQTGVKDENDQTFQGQLQNAMKHPVARLLLDESKKSLPAQKPQPHPQIDKPKRQHSRHK